MADRIGVMANGTLIADGTLDELRRQVGAAHAGPDAISAGPDRPGSGRRGMAEAGPGHASLEDTFLALVAQDATAA
jgi:ABC-type multidrug transport system ATPase subunit